jgi:signal transduction histidine kinase
MLRLFLLIERRSPIKVIDTGSHRGHGKAMSDRAPTKLSIRNGLLSMPGKDGMPPLVAASLGLVALIGLIDYLTGFEMFFSVFYLLVVALATWFIGRIFGYIISVLSVLVWAGGDLAAGMRYSKPWIMVWNAVILAVSYVIVARLLSNLRAAQQGLETRVEQRTLALRREISERQRLEEEIPNVSEREQRRIGHELHDGLCQHLTATALAGQVLSGELAAKSLPETAKADKVVELVEDGIALARNLARGLYPVEMEAQGLMDAFGELAENVRKGAKCNCVFECQSDVLIHDDSVATHLYRIGQEAVRNAVHHAKPKRIGILLSERDNRVTLAVEDDGVGFHENTPPGGGLGLRIMAHRAAMIGASFKVEPAPTGGTIITCSLPNDRA